MEQPPSEPENTLHCRDEAGDLRKADFVQKNGSSNPRENWWRKTALLVLVVVGIVGVGLYAVAESAIGSRHLRLQAEHAIARLAGFDVEISIGDVNFGFGTSSLLALDLQNVHVLRKRTGAPLIRAERLQFGLKASPLLRGVVKLTQLELTGATISAAWPVFDPAALQSPWGPKQVSRAVFGLARQIFSATEDLRYIGLSDIRLSLDALSEGRDITIDSMNLRRADQVHFAGTVRYGGRPINLKGTAQQNAQNGAIEELALDISSPAPQPESETNGPLRSFGGVRASLTGSQGQQPADSLLVLDVGVQDVLFGVDKAELLVDRIDARLGFRATAEAFSVSVSPITVGRSVLNLQGTVTPVKDGGSSTYDFDFVSRDSVIAPAQSPEPALPFATQLSGRYDVMAHRLTAEEIKVRTSGGQLMASAAVTMQPGQSPGVRLAVYADDLPTAHAKQFWPWFAARGARNWALLHVFGGRVYDSSLHLSVPPGRLGNGVPLSRDELGGRFNLVDTRFDIAGDMPPVRDGKGWVAFRGTDVKVGLNSGSIYVPGSYAVDVSSGTLTINDAHLKPRLGELEIDVSGKASAIAKLASYEPIDASRFYDLTPEDLTGESSGHILADIPLQAGIPAADLNWRVNLTYENLSIAKPVEGQKITSAYGSLVVEPNRAEITAKAELNSVPATLEIIEPLRNSGIERSRNITLELDDRAREEQLPGLGRLVSGPMRIDYAEDQGQRKKVTVDLKDARLTIPWIGWEKPAGVPARATFFMEQDEGSVKLTDFSLVGDDLSVGGNLRLVDGRLQAANLEQVQLSQGDDFSADIRGAERGYSVEIRGASLDARTIIKDVLEGKDADGLGTSESESVRLDLKLDRVQGFDGLPLEHVELNASFGSGADQLSAKAATPNYGSVALKRSAKGGIENISAATNNAGAVLSFLDIYDNVEGGQLSVALKGVGGGLSGDVTMHDFHVLNEPKLDFLVSSSSDDVQAQDLDTSRVYFDTGAATISNQGGQIRVADGVLRGPLMGATFQGLLHDANGNVAMSGTFMPFYGFNRIFGTIPIIGQILGNGRDQGLIGITFRLSGKFDNPTLSVNPISAIAPGILRQIFEYQ